MTLRSRADVNAAVDARRCAGNWNIVFCTEHQRIHAVMRNAGRRQHDACMTEQPEMRLLMILPTHLQHVARSDR